MPELRVLIGALVVAAVAATIIVTIAERLRPHAVLLSDLELIVNRRLAELLPLPHLGDRGTLLAMLWQFVPKRSLAVYAVGDPSVLIARRNPNDAPDATDARFIEIHRHRLALGAVVEDPRCGTLIPALTRSGRLTGVVIVAGIERVGLDDDTRATLRHIAGVLGCVCERAEPTTIEPASLATRRDVSKRPNVARTPA